MSDIKEELISHLGQIRPPIDFFVYNKKRKASCCLTGISSSCVLDYNTFLMMSHMRD